MIAIYKCSFTILCIIISINTFYAQVVWTVPAFPDKYEDVTVYFDASEGNGALEGFTGDVYAHTGVITTQSTSPTDWKYVIGNWGTADPRVLMTHEGNNIYSISYNITEFYNIPAQEVVLQLAFVFRNLTGTIVGRDADGSDIHTDVYPTTEGLFIILNSPGAEDIIIYRGDSLLIDATVSDTAEIFIYDNDELIYNDVDDRVSFYYHPTTNGNHVLRIEAVTDSNAVLEKKFFVLDDNVIQIDPPAGILPGLNYFTDTSYVFALNAPLKDFAFLLTIANQFSPDTNFQMHQSTNDSLFWIELPRQWFSDERNTYQYLVEGGIRVADPHSEVILDPANDPFIDADILNTLPDYPAGFTTGIVTAFDTVYRPYPFIVDDFQKPEKVKLIVYEILLRDFLQDHRFESLKDTLSYLQKLGVNAIQLMPVNEFEGNLSWGYNPSFHMAVDKYYGTRDQLKAVVDVAHQLGIAVILDVVYNHAFSQSPLAQMYWDPVNFRPAPNSPYMNVTARHPFNVGYDINHESLATKLWVKRTLSHWITEFKIDGFRFDLSKGMTQFNSGNDAGLMARYDAGRIAVLKDYADHIWNHDTSIYVIMEHFADNDEETVLSDYGMMLWGNMNNEFIKAAKGLSSDLEWADYKFRGWNFPHLVAYMESHDEERMMYRVLNEGDSEGDYNTREFTTALERVAAASSIFYSLPGPKMLWQFGELGYEFSINRCVNGTISNDCRLDPKPIRWDYLQHVERAKLRQIITSLMHLKTEYPTFSTSDYVFNDANFFVKTVHLNHPDMDAVTLANFRVIESQVNPNFQYEGRWYEYFSGDSIEVTDTQARLPFAPGEYRVYTSERITPPEGFITAAHDPLISAVNLYPNLVTTDYTISGTISANAEIENVTISDINGRRLEVSYKSNLEWFYVDLPKDLPAGVYVLTVKTAAEHFIGKLVKQ